MDLHRLAAYNQELLYLQELTGEFAESHLKITNRLGMLTGEIGDPFVQHLIQSAGFMTARPQLKLDAAFPAFSGHRMRLDGGRDRL